jgi:DNA-binding IclR family transcriptional regulator
MVVATHVPPSPRPHSAPALVPAVARAVAVMDLLARQREPLSMAHVAVALDLPKSSVHGLCNTLLSFGYLRRAENGALLIGPSVMSLAEAFVASTSVASEFDALWRGAEAAPEETLILSVLNGAEVVYVAVRNGSRPLGLAFTIGMRLPAHLAATGKAMLAHLPPLKLRMLLAHGPLPRLTGRGPATFGALEAELAQVRAQGHTVHDEGIREGVVALAAPVLDAAGAPVAGLGVCLNKAQLNAELVERQRRVVVQAAQRLSQRLGARQAGDPE